MRVRRIHRHAVYYVEELQCILMFAPYNVGIVSTGPTSAKLRRVRRRPT